MFYWYEFNLTDFLPRKVHVRKAPRTKEVTQEEKLEIELDKFPESVATSALESIRDDMIVPSSFKQSITQTKIKSKGNLWSFLYQYNISGGPEAIPVMNFPDYVKNMMQKGNRMLAHEYEVSD